MTRITVLAAAAAAVILLGIAALSAESRLNGHGTTSPQAIGQEHSPQ